MTDRTLADEMAKVLRPFARIYVGLPPDQQLALHALATARVDYLRDAYLALAHYEKERRKDDSVIDQ